MSYSKRNRMWKWPCLVVLLLSGCGVMPEEYTPPTRFDRNISRAYLEQCISGATSRTDVLMTLGEPDYSESFGQMLIYERISTSGRLNWWGHFGPFVNEYRGKATSEGDRLTISFDNRGVVTRCTYESFTEGVP